MDESNDNLFLFGGDIEEFYSDEDLDANRRVAERYQVEEELKRLRHWEDEIKMHEEHAQQHIERETKKANEYLEKATRSLHKRADWHRRNVEWWLRRKPDNIRSENFINGAVKRRKGRETVKYRDEEAAVKYLEQHAPHLLRDRSKNWKEINKRDLLSYVRTAPDDQIQELFHIEQGEETYTVETTKEEANV